MKQSYMISINGKKAVETAAKFCHENESRPLRANGRYVGTVKVEMDLPGETGGCPNRWANIENIATGKDVKVAMNLLKKFGFSGALAMIQKCQVIDGSKKTSLCAMYI